MKTLAQLKQWLHDANGQSISVSSQQDDAKLIQGLTQSSAKVQQDWVFIALPGARSHGAQYWQHAVAQGACVILSDQPIAQADAAEDLTLLVVENLTEKLADLADWFYDSPSRDVKLIGITGTNGKTSTSHYIAQMLQALSERVAIIGTLGQGELNKLQVTHNTTPDILSLQHSLRSFVDQGIDWVVMEVSSHGIALERIQGLHFACVALTQVSRDHLDFHGSEAEYRRVKARLFYDYAAQQRVVNVDDALGQELATARTVFSYGACQGLQNTIQTRHPVYSADLCSDVQGYDRQGMRLTLRYIGQNHEVALPLLGDFNRENVLCALSCLLCLGYDLAPLLTPLTGLQPIVGRMQPLALSRKPLWVLVDYAHTADALQKVLQTVRQHSAGGQLWVVFGCGGDRDRGKRPLMGAVAETYADKVVLTSDNPRTESAQAIMADIQSGMRQAAVAIADRKAAIIYALQQAQPQDIVVVAGKGHEHTQIIGEQCYPFSDQKVIEQWDKSEQMI